VEVMPTAVPGMQFSTKKMFDGYTVHMGMTMVCGKTGGKLIVQASKDNSTWETIPKRPLIGKYPPYFVDSFVHWYDFTNDILEFRPKQDPWNTASTSVWRLSRNHATSTWKLQSEGHSLIGIDTSTSLAISNVFKPLSSTDNIHILLNATNDSIEIVMPRLEVTFCLDKASPLLQSK